MKRLNRKARRHLILGASGVRIMDGRYCMSFELADRLGVRGTDDFPPMPFRDAVLAEPFRSYVENGYVDTSAGSRTSVRDDGNGSFTISTWVPFQGGVPLQWGAFP